MPSLPKRIIIVILAIVMVGISMYFFGITFGQPPIGIVLEYQAGAWTVSTVEYGTVAYESGIQVGDRATTIDGKSAESRLRQYEDAGIYYARHVESVSVATGDGEILTASQTGTSETRALLLEKFGFLFISLTFLGTGTYVIRKKPSDIAAQLLFWCGPVVTLALSATTASNSGIFMAHFVSIAAVMLGPWLLFHFFLVLPEERVILRHNRIIYLIYLPVLITLILYPIIGFEDGQTTPVYRSFRLLMAGIGFLAAVIAVIVNYVRQASNKTRQKTKIILVSCLFGVLPIIVFSLLPQVIQQQPVIPSGYTLLFLVCIPIGIAYAMITQKLMNIDIVIRKGIIQGILIIILVAFLILLLILTAPLLEQFELFQKVAVYLGIVLLTAGLYGLLHGRVSRFIDKHMYKTKYDISRVIDNLNKTMGTLSDYREISRVIVGTIVNALEPRGACLFLKTRSGSHEIAATHGIFIQPEYQQLLTELNLRKNSFLEFPNLASRVHPEVSFIMPLAGTEEEIGVLYISSRESGNKYIADDMYLLQEIVASAVISLERTLLIRDVSLRDSFVSIASHELRSPLTTIMGYADLLQQKDPPPEVREKWVQYIIDGGQRLTTIVDDLLNVTRIQSGRTVFKLEPVEVEKLIRSVVAAQSHLTDRHRFVVGANNGLPKINAEYDKLHQVLENLLNNAIKYSPGGGTITVSTGYRPDEHRVEISVRDEGIGISEEDQASLFTTFHRIHRPETYGIPGSGLGLYIVKRWVEAMGGAVWMESELDRGSTFHIAIPSVDGSVH